MKRHPKLFLIAGIFFIGLFLVVGRVAYGRNTIRELYRFAWGGSETNIINPPPPGPPPPGVELPNGDGAINGDETNVFWVSAGHYNCDPDGDGVTESGATDNPVYPDCPAGQPLTRYAVLVPASPGPVTGSAWTSYGWLDFDYTPDAADRAKYPATSGFPGQPATSAYRDANNHIRGWARLRSFKEQYQAGKGDWEGWVRLCQNTAATDPAWCTNIDDALGLITGYAWNGEVAVASTTTEMHSRTVVFGSSWVLRTSVSNPAAYHGLGWLKWDAPNRKGVRISRNPGITLTGTSVVELGPGESLPRPIHLEWIVNTDALISCHASCDAENQADCGGWNSTKPITLTPSPTELEIYTGSDDTVQLMRSHVVFRLTCIGNGGIEFYGDWAVSSVCYDRDCDYKDEKCSQTPHITNVGNVCIQSCNNDNQCLRPDVNWKEVSP